MSRLSKFCLIGTSLFALCFLPSLHARGAPDVRTRSFDASQPYGEMQFHGGHPGEYHSSYPGEYHGGYSEGFHGHSTWGDQGPYSNWGRNPFQGGYSHTPINYGYYGSEYPGTPRNYSYSNYNTYNDTNFPGPYSQYYQDSDGNGVGTGIYYNVR